eukprot:GHVS01106606.1.p1 GENE.GHVS01106606.1~~GHVS01106606.1.p1  ORF type:complete len:846 (-),score=189.99 GHVS01106606.1:1233-3770(-)
MKILKTQLCIFHSRGECNRGDRCSFAHCLNELRERPNFKKSKLCYAYRADSCYNPYCNFAHGEQELVPSELTHKKALCKLFAEGNCRDGEQCTYAHSIDEVRTRCIFTPPPPPGSLPPGLVPPPTVKRTVHNAGSNNTSQITSSTTTTTYISSQTATSTSSVTHYPTTLTTTATATPTIAASPATTTSGGETTSASAEIPQQKLRQQPQEPRQSQRLPRPQPRQHATTTAPPAGPRAGSNAMWVAKPQQEQAYSQPVTSAVCTSPHPSRGGTINTNQQHYTTTTTANQTLPVPPPPPPPPPPPHPRPSSSGFSYSICSTPHPSPSSLPSTIVSSPSTSSVISALASPAFEPLAGNMSSLSSANSTPISIRDLQHSCPSGESTPHSPLLPRGDQLLAATPSFLPAIVDASSLLQTASGSLTDGRSTSEGLYVQQPSRAGSSGAIVHRANRFGNPPSFAAPAAAAAFKGKGDCLAIPSIGPQDIKKRWYAHSIEEDDETFGRLTTSATQSMDNTTTNGDCMTSDESANCSRYRGSSHSSGFNACVDEPQSSTWGSVHTVQPIGICPHPFLPSSLSSSTSFSFDPSCSPPPCVEAPDMYKYRLNSDSAINGCCTYSYDTHGRLYRPETEENNVEDKGEAERRRCGSVVSGAYGGSSNMSQLVGGGGGVQTYNNNESGNTLKHRVFLTRGGGSCAYTATTNISPSIPASSTGHYGGDNGITRQERFGATMEREVSNHSRRWLDAPSSRHNSIGGCTYSSARSTNGSSSSSNTRTGLAAVGVEPVYSGNRIMGGGVVGGGLGVSTDSSSQGSVNSPSRPPPPLPSYMDMISCLKVPTEFFTQLINVDYDD